MAKSQINAAELDVNLISENFKKFLTSQDAFKDYNFEGSNLSVLIDILSYNTHYNNLYTNFSLNEVFLDSAVKRDSIVSLAKNLGYTPRSAIAPKAKVKVTVINTSTGLGDILILQRGAIFNSVLGNNTYPYVTNKPYTAVNNNGSYVFDSVDLYQGELLSNRYVYQEGIRFIIPNAGCDLTTLSVKVQESSTNSTFAVYSSVDNIVDSTRNSLTYYVKEIENQLYEIYFGENVIGKQPEVGNIITIEYLSTSGEESNGTRTFSYNGESLANGLVGVITLEESVSGKNIESAESIRVNAPNSYSAQNRGVNTSDYKTIIYNTIPNIDSVSVWGGEDNIPVQYGKVFISIKPFNRDNLTSLEKTSVLSVVKAKGVLGITPEIKDPDIIDIILNTSVYYEPAKTSRTPKELSLLVTQNIAEYNLSISKFNENFKYSALSRIIDSTDNSITNSLTQVSLIKRYKPKLNTNILQTINIYNPIDKLYSANFYVQGISNPVYLSSDDEIIGLYTVQENTIIKIRDVGSINRKTGEIIIKNINITSIVNFDEGLELFISVLSNDIISKLNQISVINLVKSSVNIIINNPNDYIFTPNKA